MFVVVTLASTQVLKNSDSLITTLISNHPALVKLTLAGSAPEFDSKAALPSVQGEYCIVSPNSIDISVSTHLPADKSVANVPDV